MNNEHDKLVAHGVRTSRAENTIGREAIPPAEASGSSAQGGGQRPIRSSSVKDITCDQPADTSSTTESEKTVSKVKVPVTNPLYESTDEVDLFDATQDLTQDDVTMNWDTMSVISNTSDISDINSVDLQLNQGGGEISQSSETDEDIFTFIEHIKGTKRTIDECTSYCPNLRVLLNKLFKARQSGKLNKNDNARVLTIMKKIKKHLSTHC